MCFGSKQPAAPIQKPNYKPEDMDDYFTVTMEDGQGDKKLISERDEKANKAATGYKET